MSAFPVYTCFMVDKLMCGLIGEAGSFTNDNTICDRSLGALNLEPYRKTVSSHNMALESIKDCINQNGRWENYPLFLQGMYEYVKRQEVGSDLTQVPDPQLKHLNHQGS